MLLPFVVPTVLSAIAFWWIYDSQFSIISWVLIKIGLIHHYIDFLGDPWNARWSVVAANIWRGVPFVAITLLAGLQTISPSLYEAADLDGATNWQRFRFITLPMLSPIIAVVMTFSVLMTFTDFQLIYTHHARRPDQRDASDGDAVVPACHHRRSSRRGRCDRQRHDPVPGGGDPVQLLRPAAPQMAAGREGLTMASVEDNSDGMSYLESLPRRALRVYLPLGLILVFLLFPFYWMATTTFKPDAEMYDYEKYNPFWVAHPTLEHIKKLLFETDYPQWMYNTVIVSVSSTFISLFASVCAAYAIERLRYRGSRYVGARRSSSPIWCRPRSCSSRWPRSCSSSACSTAIWR